MKRMLFIIAFTASLFFLTACTDTTITINFETNGGSKIESYETDSNINITSLDEPTRDGYIFSGWFFDDETFNEPFSIEALAEHPIINELTLYAKWEQEVIEYTVSFESATDDSIENQVILDGESIDEPDALSRDGYTFNGWYTSDDALWSFDNPVTGNMTLYAKWDANRYDVDFVNSEHNVIETNTIAYQTDLSNVACPIIEKDGFQFIGWFLDEAFTIPFDEQLMPAEDITVYPQYAFSYLIYEYINEDEVMITDYLGGSPIVVIPETINGRTVTTIEDYALRFSNITSITIPETLINVGHLAFGNNDYEEIIILGDQTRFNDVWEYIGFLSNDNPTYIHEDGFYFNPVSQMINSYDGGETEIVIPSMIGGLEVLGIHENAFNRRGLTSVSIPETIVTIEAYAFSYNQISSVEVLGDTSRFNDVWELIGFDSALNVSYVNQDGILFDETSGTIKDYIGSEVNLVIPSSINGIAVTSIGAYALSAKNLTSVEMPSSIITIGSNAFRNNDLTSIVIPDSVISIEENAFSYNQLSSVTLSNGLVSIGFSAFYINDLTEIHIPESVETIGGWAFGYNQITDVTIAGDPLRFNDIWHDLHLIDSANQSYVTVDGFIFDPNTGTIVDYIGAEENLVIPREINGVEVSHIGDHAFYVVFTLNDDSFKISSLTLPDTIVSIGDSAFTGNNITTLMIPNSVKSIGDQAFSGNGLTSVALPNAIEYIGDYAFSGNLLSTVDIPTTIEILNEGVFGSNLLTSITIPANIKVIGVYAFSGNLITEVVLPDTLEVVEHGAFRDNKIASVTFPDTKIEIGDFAFSFNLLEDVDIPEYMAVIPQGLFSDNLLTRIEIPDTVFVIGEYAFTRNNLTEVIIPNSVTNIDFGAFSRNKLTEVVIPNSVLRIDNFAFRDNDITSLILSDSLMVIGFSAFQSNELETITIPASVISIESDVFNNNLLTEVHILGDETRFNDDWEDIGFPLSSKPTA